MYNVETTDRVVAKLRADTLKFVADSRVGYGIRTAVAAKCSPSRAKK